MNLIPLTQNQFAMVDDSEVEAINAYKWFCARIKGRYVAVRKSHGPTRRNIYMHRVIMNAPRKMEVDHIDGNGLNNQKSNLRLCVTLQNVKNRKIPITNKSGFKGVHWDVESKKWKAQISCNGKQKSIGRFHDKIDAAEAYDACAISMHGEFAKTNAMLGRL